MDWVLRAGSKVRTRPRVISFTGILTIPNPLTACHPHGMARVSNVQVRTRLWGNFDTCGRDPKAPQDSCRSSQDCSIVRPTHDRPSGVSLAAAGFCAEAGKFWRRDLLAAGRDEPGKGEPVCAPRWAEACRESAPRARSTRRLNISSPRDDLFDIRVDRRVEPVPARTQVRLRLPCSRSRAFALALIVAGLPDVAGEEARVLCSESVERRVAGSQQQPDGRGVGGRGMRRPG